MDPRPPVIVPRRLRLARRERHHKKQKYSERLADSGLVASRSRFLRVLISPFILLTTYGPGPLPSL